MRKPKLLISNCLLGLPCRYNGECKKHPLLDALDEKYDLVGVCPEVLGGLEIPRAPAEIRGTRVITSDGQDVTREYEFGAEVGLDIAKGHAIRRAVLQERSPSCGSGVIHDGTFSGGLVEGDGKFAALLKANGIEVLGDSAIKDLI